MMKKNISKTTDDFKWCRFRSNDDWIKLPNTSFMSADCLRILFKSSTILIVSSINWYFDYRSQINHNEISPNGKYLR